MAENTDWEKRYKINQKYQAKYTGLNRHLTELNLDLTMALIRQIRDEGMFKANPNIVALIQEVKYALVQADVQSHEFNLFIQSDDYRKLAGRDNPTEPSNVPCHDGDCRN